MVDEINESYHRFQRLQPSQKLLQEAVAAVEVGHVAKFESMAKRAISRCPPEEHFLSTLHSVVASHLLRIDREVDAVRHYELALPMVGVFKALETIFRRRAKARKKSGDIQGAIDEMNRIVSLLWIRRSLYDQGLLSNDIDRRRARAAVDRIEAKSGTIYAWSYVADGVPEGTLSASDRKLIEKLLMENR